ncbi:Ig-like domain-containing protein [Aeromonas veronii]
MNRLLFFWGLIVVFLLAGCGGGDSNDGAPSNIKKSLQEISIELMETPILGVSTLSVIVGQELSFKAIGKFDDGTIQDLTSSVSWFLDHPESIHINASGRAIGISVGKSTIKANFNGIISNGITIDTISPHLQEITITFNRDNLPIGSLIQAKAIGIYENGITSNITSLVEWSSSLALVSFQKDGLLKPISVGIDVITASYQGIISSPRDIKVTDAIIESISISSKSTKIDKNLTTRFTATAIYSDNTEVDVTNSAKWSSSNVNIATVDNTGLVNAIAVGNANIQASFSGKTSQSVTLNVTAPTLEKLEIITTKRHFLLRKSTI